MCKNYLFRKIALIYFLLFSLEGSICKDDRGKRISWCTVSGDEQHKCEVLSKAIDEKTKEFGQDYHTLKCVQGSNKENCMTMIDQEEADVTSVDAGLVYVASRYHSLIPIMQEVFGDRQTHYYSVAIIKRDTLSDVSTLNDLKGKRACFAAVGTLAGWYIPVATLMKSGGMEIYDCNNHIKSAINYFGDSCAVNSLITKYNPIGDNSDKLCKICGGTAVGEKCTVNDPYYGYHGAIQCLMDKGEIAFVKHSSIQDLENPNGFELLCKDGSRQPVFEYSKCNWGRVPSDAIITTTAKSAEDKEGYQRFFKVSSIIFFVNFTVKESNFTVDSIFGIPLGNSRKT